MRIYIPTNRGPDRQITYDLIPSNIRDEYGVNLLVETREEAEVLRSKGYWAEFSGVAGIGPARQWILDKCPEPKVLMLDDDLSNWSIKSASGSYLKGDNEAIFKDAFEAIEHRLNSVAHTAIGHRQFCNGKPLWESNGRYMRALGFRPEVLRAKDIRITLPLMEDFELNLKLLTQGFKNSVYYGVVQDQYKSNAPGGCSDMRTLELQEHSAKELKRMFPEFVTLKIVDGWDIGPRYDVSVQWKRAFGAYK